MAGASLLTLIDDITLILDDVSVMTKVAAKKTAGVLGDDLALNANQVAGVKADRELPVVWAVAKGSAINKVILVPLALLISAVSPMLVTILLMLGGLFLCFEGAEKVLHKFLHSKEEDDKDHEEHLIANADNVDLVALEKDKIKGAIRTDFILSAEIIVISLGTMAATVTLMNKALVLTLISIVMTVGVYGLVAGIVKLDDLGLHLLQKPSEGSQKMGRAILAFAPKLMQFLSIAGTLAMFLVGGGIIAHGIGFIHHGIEHLGEMSGMFSGLTTNVLNGLVGLVAGLIVVGIVTVINKARGKAH
ncbi:DUF808 domain-containing protein [Faucicola boevrei]|uniref:DUF808 domain-containing protein n=1 Tax=Faucicola boevrei TaxID=346665 RepID=UPI00036DD08B|nr:DUF808 domain-containing protein [Moraxella boevrei]